MVLVQRVSGPVLGVSARSWGCQVISWGCQARSRWLYFRGGCQFRSWVISGMLERANRWVRQVTGLSLGIVGTGCLVRRVSECSF